MTNPIEAWHVEHAYFERLLALLHKQVDAFHSGSEPSYELMLDIINYLRNYSDAVHHPREDVAFARLARHCPDISLVLARLAQEHRVIVHAGEMLRNHLIAALAGSIVPRQAIEAAAATYLVYYRRHIRREEKEVLPRAAQALTPEDWEAVRKAVPDCHDPIANERSAEHYRHLRRQIALES